MAGSARVHVHTVRKRSLCLSAGAQPSLPQHSISAETAAVVVDDDADNDAAQRQFSPEVSMPEQWSPRLQARKRSKPLDFPTQQERIIHPPALLAQLSVVELPTSGHQNNCLWFSVQRATGQLSATEQFTVAAEHASNRGRKQIHQELLRALPAAAAHRNGSNDEWAQANRLTDSKTDRCRA